MKRNEIQAGNIVLGIPAHEHKICCICEKFRYDWSTRVRTCTTNEVADVYVGTAILKILAKF